MKKRGIFLVICLLLYPAWGIYAEAFSQSKVSLKMQNVTLDRVFQTLSKQLNYEFLYNHTVVKQKGSITVNVVNENLEDFLDSLLQTVGMECFVDDKVIIIKEKQSLPQMKSVVVKGKVKDSGGGPLPGVSVSIKGTTWGTVTNSEGEFSVELADSEDIVLLFSFIGMKNVELKFAGQKMLEVTMYEEMQTLEDVVVTGYQVIDKRKLTSAISTVRAEELDRMGALTVDQMLEGKAPGLMIVNVSAQPGAASKMRVRAGGTFTGTREPLWVIDGVVYEDPVPLSAADINSLDQINLIGNAISGLNPQDIAQIDVLKDASATAIYGTRAANGVIVVTTKRGKSGSLYLNYSGTVSIVDRPRYSDFQLMNSKERIDVSREIVQRNLHYPDEVRSFVGYEGALKKYYDRELDFAGFQDEVSRLERMNTDWFGELYRVSVKHSHGVSVSGGTDKMRVYAGLNYDNQEGSEIHTGLTRFSGRINTDFNLRKNILISVGLSGSSQKADYNHSAYSIFDEAAGKSRAVPVRDEEGKLVYQDMIYHTYGLAVPLKYNILEELDNSRHIVRNKDLNMRASVDWEIVRGLKVRSQFSYRNTTNIDEEWMTEKTKLARIARTYAFPEDKKDENVLQFSMLPFGGLYKSGTTSSESYTLTTQVNYGKSVGEKHHFNINLGHEVISTSYKGASGWEAPGYNHEQGRTFIKLPSLFVYAYDPSQQIYAYLNMINWLSDKSNTNNLLASHDIYPDITDSQSNTLSFFGIFNYQYSDRYIFNFNLRSDGSNRFGQYERYKFRPAWSASFRWNVHAEGFMEEWTNTFLDELAFRVSYGFRGTVPNASPYLIIKDYGQTHAGVSPEFVSSLSDFPNADLKWERTKTVNGGLNFSVLGGRVNGAVDYAYSRSLDLLLTRPVSLVNGKASHLYNGGTKEDHTIEFNVIAQAVKLPKFRWNVNFNFSRVTEKILEGFDDNIGLNSVQDFLNGTIYRKGFPLDGFYSYRFNGLNEQGEPTFVNFAESAQYNPGQEYDNEVILRELEKALVYEGNRLPKFYGGFGTEFKYANLTLSAGFSYKVGQKVRLLELYPGGSQNMPMPEGNMSSVFVNRWRQPGDEAHTDIPALSNADLSNNNTSAYLASPYILPWQSTLWWAYDQSDVRTAKGSYIRWQNLSLYYDVPDKKLRRLGVSNVRIGFQTQNLCVFTFDKKLKGMDPEQVRNLGLPVLPSYNFSLNFSF